jgi:thiamine biosynthesis protein ThiS
MKIKLNGENHNHNGNGSINSLLDELKLNKDHAAVMLNGNIVPQENWKIQMINENDEVEVLVFVGGG